MKTTKHIKKDGTTVYRTTVYLGVDTLTGKKVKTTITARTERELKNKVDSEKANFKKNGSTRLKEVRIDTFSDLVRLWFDSNAHTLKVNSIKAFNSQLNKYLLPAYGRYPLEKLTAPIIQHQVIKWAKEYNQGKGGYKLYPELHALSKRILQYGVSLQAIPSNPARDIIVPKRIDRNDEKPKHFTNQNLSKFLTYLDSLDNSFSNYFDIVLYKLLLATGLRISEALALEWSDLDLKKGRLEVNKTLNSENTTNKPKTKTSNRTIPLDKKTVLTLRMYHARLNQLGTERGVNYSKVFPNLKNGYCNQNVLRRHLKKHLTNAGCPLLSFHAFRHTHASILINANAGYKEVQERLGHATLSMTMDTYSHLSKENKDKTANLYEKALENIKSS